MLVHVCHMGFNPELHSEIVYCTIVLSEVQFNTDKYDKINNRSVSTEHLKHV